MDESNAVKAVSSALRMLSESEMDDQDVDLVLLMLARVLEHPEIMG